MVMFLTMASVNDVHKVCDLCNTNASKYCCPKCDAMYCSLDCYKSEKHAECSENFYRDCITEELVGNEADPESKQKMIDILTKMQQHDFKENEDYTDSDENGIDSDDEEAVDLQNRLEGLNLDNADEVWNALTEEEKNEFTAFVSAGDVGTVIPQWEPWWLFKKKGKLVEEIENVDKLEEEALKKCPMLKKVVKLSELTNVKPSPIIKFNVINVLAAYAFVARYFNGELEPIEATIYLLTVCANLDENTNFEDPQIAVESVLQKCIQSEIIETDEDSLEVTKHDVLLILNGPSKVNKVHYCKAALSHIYYILFEAKNAGKSSQKEEVKIGQGFSKKFPDLKLEHLPKLDISKVKKCIKKIDYYLSYIESYGMISE